MSNSARMTISGYTMLQFVLDNRVEDILITVTTPKTSVDKPNGLTIMSDTFWF